MSQFVNIPTAEWRKHCALLASIKESLDVLNASGKGTSAWLTKEQAKAKLNFKSDTKLYLLRKTGTIAYSKSNGKSFLYSAKDIEQYIIKNSSI